MYPSLSHAYTHTRAHAQTVCDMVITNTVLSFIPFVVHILVHSFVTSFFHSFFRSFVYSAVPRAFSVVARQLTLVKKTLQSSPNSGMSQTLGDAIQGPVAVDHILYSTDRGRIFFSDKFGKVIASINMDGTGKM